MIKINNKAVEINHFPDGTLHLNIDKGFEYCSDFLILWKYENDSEMFALYSIVKHLRKNSGYCNIILQLPYIPNARMDRVKNSYEVFTLKYFCEFINDLKFDSVYVNDAHSPVSLALLNNAHEDNMEDNIHSLISNIHPDIVFYPDEGSMKRHSDSIKYPYAFGIKNRDWNTGKILNVDILGSIPTEKFNVLIIDDICSYGGTFLHSAQKLKELGANEIYLYITHCENSVLKGELINSGLLTKIFTTDSIYTGSHSLIEVI